MPPHPGGIGGSGGWLLLPSSPLSKSDLELKGSFGGPPPLPPIDECIWGYYCGKASLLDT